MNCTSSVDGMERHDREWIMKPPITTMPAQQAADGGISMEKHIHQTNERLQVIRQQLSTAHGFVSAARELMDWCSDIRAFQPQYEMNLLNCLHIVSRFSASPGFDLELGFQLLCVCARHKDRFSPQHVGEFVPRGKKKRRKKDEQ